MAFKGKLNSPLQHVFRFLPSKAREVYLALDLHTIGTLRHT